MNYLSKFDAEGYRQASIPCDITLTKEQKEEYLKEGYIEHNQEDWLYYTGGKGQGENNTGYIRDNETGKPISAPPLEYVEKEKVKEEREVPEETLALAEGVAELTLELENLKAQLTKGEK